MVSQSSFSRKRDWQRTHYEAVGARYGALHFTQPDNPYTAWILDQIGAVSPHADAIAEVGAGTCVFASLLGAKMQTKADVVCYEPVEELIEAAAAFENVKAVCGDALDFASKARDAAFDLIFTKDTAHHFLDETLDDIHCGMCRKLKSGGRYLMVVRSPPSTSVPVGSIARGRWKQVYTPFGDLLSSMRRVADWREVRVTQWQMAVETIVEDWMEGVEQQNSWSIFSALSRDEIATTIGELEEQFRGIKSFDFVHQYDVAVFEKIGRRPVAL